ncbi:hypothetical protein OUZ56_005139 [Daphnia magna]|uniref:Uncharacterized protein n=1 Tax=Daphnia magna TaxID=35525 RepID=A0ABQ9YRY3_9CRUS|nr:hypothetical protein OUZ56_005139 [Daphnia magna]
MCFKGFFIKKFTIAFCMWWCFALSAMPAAELAACIPAINNITYLPIPTSSSSSLSSLAFHRKSSLLILLFYLPLLSQLTWIGFNNISFFGLQIFIFLRYNTAVLTISVVSPLVDHTQLHFLRLPVIVVYDFTSTLSSLTSSPSSPSRHLRRLCLRHHLVAGFSFAFHVGNSPWIVALLTRWLPPRLRPIFFVAYRDRPQWPSPQGALGNAPVGTSLCRCGGGLLRVCIPCNGFRHRVSPDLSSDKSHLVRDP